MPEGSRARSLGRGIEAVGWTASLAGLIWGGVLSATEGPIAHQITAATLWLMGRADPSLTTTLTGLICLLPGLALMQLGGKIGGTPSLTDQCIARLMQRHGPSTPRRLAALVCLLIAALAFAALLSFWPEIRDQVTR